MTTVFCFRSEEDGARLAAFPNWPALVTLPLQRPVLCPPPCDALKADTWLFTSRYGVQAVRTCPGAQSFGGNLWCVGENTASLALSTFPSAVITEAECLDALLEKITYPCKPLYFRGKSISRPLPGSLKATEHIVYSMLERREHFPAYQQKLKETDSAAVLLYSAGQATLYTRLAPLHADRWQHIAISKRVARALPDGYPCTVASTPTTTAMLAALRQHILQL